MDRCGPTVQMGQVCARWRQKRGDVSYVKSLLGARLMHRPQRGQHLSYQVQRFPFPHEKAQAQGVRVICPQSRSRPRAEQMPPRKVAAQLLLTQALVAFAWALCAGHRERDEAEETPASTAGGEGAVAEPADERDTDTAGKRWQSSRSRARTGSTQWDTQPRLPG